MRLYSKLSWFIACFYVTLPSCVKKSPDQSAGIKQNGETAPAGEDHSKLDQVEIKQSPFASVKFDEVDSSIKTILWRVFKDKIIGWETGKSNSPSFNFNVDGKKMTWDRVRETALKSNMDAAQAILKNPPDLAVEILESLKTSSKVSAELNESSKEVVALANILADASKVKRYYTYEGTLVVVRWGDADPETTKSDQLPLKADRVATNIAFAAAQKFIEVVQGPVELKAPE